MARSKISLIVAPRPLLPEEAEANQAPLMLVGPDRCSIYVRSSPTATTGQRFSFGTHATAVLPPNEPAQTWLSPRLGELAEEVCAGGAAALMIIGGAGSGKRSVLLGAEGGASEGALHAAVSALRARGQQRLQLSWRALAAESSVDLLGAAEAGGQAAPAVACLPVDTREQLQEATRLARDASRLAGGRLALQLLQLSSAEPHDNDAQGQGQGQGQMLLLVADAANAPPVPGPLSPPLSPQEAAVEALRMATRGAAAHEAARARLLEWLSAHLRRSDRLVLVRSPESEPRARTRTPNPKPSLEPLTLTLTPNPQPSPKTKPQDEAPSLALSRCTASRRPPPPSASR